MLGRLIRFEDPVLDARLARTEGAEAEAGKAGQAAVSRPHVEKKEYTEKKHDDWED